MENREVAAALSEIADLMELTDENPFKVRAYRRAAQAVELLPEQVAEVARRGRLTAVPDIGKATAERIVELLATGRIEYLEELRRAVPPGVRELTLLPGLGARTAHLLYSRLGIDSLDRLELAARRGDLRDLPGMGARKEAAILDALERLRTQGERIPLGAVRPLALALVEHLRRHPAVAAAEVAGSVRRGCDMVGDIDLAIASGSPEEVLTYVQGLPIAGEPLERTAGRLVLRTSLGRRIEAVVSPPEEYGLTLLRLTGSEVHLQQLGLLRAVPTEDEAYAAVGLPFIAPELREGAGEVEAARSGLLPVLIQVHQIRGDLHAHTRYSDGTATIQEMAEAARALGRSYLAICDHSRSLAIARGLTPERLAQQAEEIRRTQGSFPDLKLLSGTEVDILKDGSLDFPDTLLARLDLVVASIHSHMKLDRTAQTDRLVRAIENPHVDIIGHPTGRVLGRRDPYDLDWDRVFEACARTGTALEISASPSRLDLSAPLARQARQRGVKLAINTDAHSIHELQLMEYGVVQARRAWLEAADVVNTMETGALLAWLAREKG